MPKKLTRDEIVLKTVNALTRARKARRTAEAIIDRRGRTADQVYVEALRARDDDMTTARETITRIGFEAAIARNNAKKAIEAADEATKPTLQSPEDAHEAALTAQKAELGEANAMVESIRDEAEQQKTAFLEPFLARLKRTDEREKKARLAIEALTDPEPVRKQR